MSDSENERSEKERSDKFWASIKQMCNEHTVESVHGKKVVMAQDDFLALLHKVANLDRTIKHLHFLEYSDKPDDYGDVLDCERFMLLMVAINEALRSNHSFDTKVQEVAKIESGYKDAEVSLKNITESSSACCPIRSIRIREHCVRYLKHFDCGAKTDDVPFSHSQFFECLRALPLLNELCVLRDNEVTNEQQLRNEAHSKLPPLDLESFLDQQGKKGWPALERLHFDLACKMSSQFVSNFELSFASNKLTEIRLENIVAPELTVMPREPGCSTLLSSFVLGLARRPAITVISLWVTSSTQYCLIDETCIKALCMSVNLKDLKLCNFGIGDSDIICFAKYLPASYSLQSLHLTGIQVKEESCHHIYQAMKHQYSLIRLSIHDTYESTSSEACHQRTILSKKVDTYIRLNHAGRGKLFRNDNVFAGSMIKLLSIASHDLDLLFDLLISKPSFCQNLACRRFQTRVNSNLSPRSNCNSVPIHSGIPKTFQSPKRRSEPIVAKANKKRR